MTRFFLAVWLAWPALAAVGGTVHNRTTGKAQSGATVTLYRLGENGPESIESVKSDAQGKFRIEQDIQGPRLLQAAYGGVTYNHMLPPGTPSSNVDLDVYDSSKQPGAASVAQHMILVEPSRGQLAVSDTYVFENAGKTAWNDPDAGTLRFYLPAAANGAVQVNCTAPQGMPIRRAAEKTKQPNIYKIDFPIKPGETRIDVGYQIPFTAPGPFEGRVLYKGGPTRIVAPEGVTVTGNGIASLGQEPRTRATIYNVTGNEFRAEIAGTGALRRGEAQASDENSGPPIEEIPPRVYTRKIVILALAFGALALGFILLYRAPKAGNAGHRA